MPGATYPTTEVHNCSSHWNLDLKVSYNVIHACYTVMCEGKRKDGREWQEVGNMGRLDAQWRYFNCQEVKKPSSSEVISEYVLA